jgi:hypothetical protein
MTYEDSTTTGPCSSLGAYSLPTEYILLYSSEKYCISRNNYPFFALLADISGIRIS